MLSSPPLLHLIITTICAAGFTLATGCIMPQPKEIIAVTYDSLRNTTVLRSQPELVEIYPAMSGDTPEFRLQAMYECPGNDTACLPLALRMRLMLAEEHVSTQFGRSDVGRDAVRYREGDNITVKGDNWNMTLIIDSIGTSERQESFYRGNTSYLRRQTTQFIYFPIAPERLQMLASSQALTFSIAGKQSFIKLRREPLKYLLEYCQQVRAKMGR